MLNGIVSFSRRLRRQPLSVLPFVGVLPLGLTACVAVYSILDHFFVKPVPFPEAKNLVAISSSRGTTSERLFGADIGRPALRELSASPAFEDIGGWSRRRAYWGSPAEDIVTRWVASSGLFRALRITPAMGRAFSAAEDAAPTDVAIVSWECWQRRLGGRPDVLDQTITLTDALTPGAPPEVMRVVGVLPRGFRLHGEAPEVVLPVGNLLPNVGSFNVIARLAPGVRLEAVQALASSVLATGGPQPPTGGRVTPLRQALAASLAPSLGLLVTVVGVLLVITATSATGLVLNDLMSRSQEFGVRLALGADENTLRREVVVEHALKALLAACISVGLASPLPRLLTSFAPAELMGHADLEIDRRVLLWGLGSATVTSVLMGVVPVVTVLSRSNNLASVSSNRAMPQWPRVQKATAALQLAVSLALLLCAALLGRTLGNLSSTPIGIDPTNVAVASFTTTVSPPVVSSAGVWPHHFASWVHTESLLDAVKSTPGVAAAAAVSSAPFTSDAPVIRLRPDESGTETLDVLGVNVTSEYFEVMGMPILAGRGLEPGDRPSDIRQTLFRIVASRALQDVLGGNVVGRRLATADGNQTYEIVGVVSDVRQRSRAGAAEPTVYGLSATYYGVRHIVARTSRAAEQLLPAVRRAVVDFDRSILVTRTATMSSLLSQSVAAERFRALMAMAIGAIALGLAAVGVFLLGLRLVHARRREFGLRLALGAGPHDVLLLVLRDTAAIVAPGIALGWPASYAAARYLESFLVGVSWFDPVSLLVGMVVLTGAVLVAIIGPARRALRIDPALALRSEE